MLATRTDVRYSSDTLPSPHRPALHVVLHFGSLFLTRQLMMIISVMQIASMRQWLEIQSMLCLWIWWISGSILWSIQTRRMSSTPPCSSLDRRRRHAHRCSTVAVSHQLLSHTFFSGSRRSGICFGDLQCVEETQEDRDAVAGQCHCLPGRRSSLAGKRGRIAGNGSDADHIGPALGRSDTESSADVDDLTLCPRSRNGILGNAVRHSIHLSTIVANLSRF